MPPKGKPCIRYYYCVRHPTMCSVSHKSQNMTKKKHRNEDRYKNDIPNQTDLTHKKKLLNQNASPCNSSVIWYTRKPMDEITRVPQVVFWLHHLYLFYSADSDDILYLHELCEVPPMFTSIFFSSADSDDLLYLDELCEVPPCCSWEGCWQPNKRDAFKSFVKRRADSYTSQSSPGGILFGCSTPPPSLFPSTGANHIPGIIL